MREEIEEAYQESKSLKMEEYEKALAEYNSKFKIWKHQRTKKVNNENSKPFFYYLSF